MYCDDSSAVAAATASSMALGDPLAESAARDSSSSAAVVGVVGVGLVGLLAGLAYRRSTAAAAEASAPLLAASPGKIIFDAL